MRDSSIVGVRDFLEAGARDSGKVLIVVARRHVSSDWFVGDSVSVLV
jgi:hypothetical protein